MEYKDADVRLETRVHHPSPVSATALIIAIALSVVTTLGKSEPSGSSLRLVAEFKKTAVFWLQREIAEQLVAVHDPAILSKLVPWLTNEDRHLRANAAYVFASMATKEGSKSFVQFSRTALTDRRDRVR